MIDRVGHKLIERCLDWTKEKGARLIYTETGRGNERAIGLCQRHGLRLRAKFLTIMHAGKLYTLSSTR